MDIVEINKRTQHKWTDPALDKMFSLGKLTKDESLTLVLLALKKYYGLNHTVKIIHGLGVKKI